MVTDCHSLKTRLSCELLKPCAQVEFETGGVRCKDSLHRKVLKYRYLLLHVAVRVLS